MLLIVILCANTPWKIMSKFILSPNMKSFKIGRKGFVIYQIQVAPPEEPLPTASASEIAIYEQAVANPIYGGWVESESNLSQEGNCWIDSDAIVVGNSVVSGDSRVTGKAYVQDSKIAGNSKIEGNARVVESTVSGQSLITDNADVNRCDVESSVIKDSVHFKIDPAMPPSVRSSCRYSKVSENVLIFGEASLQDATISGEVFITHTAKVHGGVISGKGTFRENCFIKGDPIITGDFLIEGDCEINGTGIEISATDGMISIYGNANITTNTKIKTVGGMIQIYGNAYTNSFELETLGGEIFGECRLIGGSIKNSTVAIFGRSVISGGVVEDSHIELFGDAEITGDVKIRESSITMYGFSKLKDRADLETSLLMHGTSVIENQAEIRGKVFLQGGSKVTDYVKVQASLTMQDDSVVSNNVIVDENVVLKMSMKKGLHAIITSQQDLEDYKNGVYF